MYACNGHNAHGLMYFRKLNSRLLDRICHCLQKNRAYKTTT